LLDGETKRHLHELLSEDNGKYIANCMHTIQRGCDAGTREELVKEVLRYLPPKEPQREGFVNMLNCALGVPNAPIQEHTEPESHPNSAFTRMLEESGKGSIEREEAHTAIPKTTIRMTGMLRQIDESQFPQFCDPKKCPKDFARHCSANRPENHGKPCIYITPRNR
jgi:hypothetical protein